MGAVSQLRVMGGAIGLSIATSVFNSYTKPKMAELLREIQAPPNFDQSLQSISLLESSDQQRIKAILARGYNLQMFVLCALGALQIPTAFLMWRKKQMTV